MSIKTNIILLYLTCLLQLQGAGQSYVDIANTFSSSDTMLNYIKVPSLNAWGFRCPMNFGGDCFAYWGGVSSGQMDWNNCALTTSTYFFPFFPTYGNQGPCETAFINGMGNTIGIIGGLCLGALRQSVIFSPFSSVQGPSSWIESPQRHATCSFLSASSNEFCHDSADMDLRDILLQSSANPADTMVSGSFSFEFVSGGTFFDMGYIMASDEYDTNMTAAVNYIRTTYGGTYSDSNHVQRILGNYNEGIGIFLQGPGVNGPYHANSENIALVPNTTDAICTRNIHPQYADNGTIYPASNAQYYVQADSLNQFVFDGFTTPLNVKKIPINPCDTYRVTLSIAQAGDFLGTTIDHYSRLGSTALIIEKNSAKTGFWLPAPLQLYDGYGQDTLVEGCPGVVMRFVRFFQLGQTDSIHLMYEGSASWGVDYDSLPEWVFFQPGQDTLEFLITPKADTLVEGIEKLVIRLMPPGVYNCPVDTTEVELWIADRPPFDAVMADTFFFDPCNSDSIAIGPSYVAGLPPVSYLWSTGATTPFINVATLNNSNYSLTIYDACQNDSIILTTVTRSAPAPQISLINNDSVINCAQGLLPIGFEVLANYYPQFEYKWASGETDSIIYVNPLENGTYNYSFKILRPCMPDSFEYNITIHVENDPVLLDLSDEAAKHCPGFEYTLSPEISGGYLPYWFVWNSGDTSLDISVSPLVTDTYFFSVTDVCGLDTVVGRSIVNVPHYDSLIISGNDHINLPCPIGYVNIRSGDYRGSGGLAGSSEKDYEYSWDNWQSTGMALQFYLDHDTLLTLRMRDTCGVDEGELSVTVRVFNGPFLSASFPDTLHVCLGDPVYLIPEVKDGVKPYVYNWGNGSSDSLRALVPETPISTYKITVSDFCDFVKTDQVVVSATRPTADFAETNDSYDPQSVTFENRSEGAVTYTWFFGEENTSLEPNPTYHFETLSETQVKLVVEDRYGCQDSTERVLDIPLNLFIPNSFTPNGDNLNETWQPLGYGFETLAYTVFDRWGNEVYSCALPECFDWNGNSKGKPLESGVYAYIITVKLINGSKREVSGQVNLMR